MQRTKTLRRVLRLIVLLVSALLVPTIPIPIKKASTLARYLGCFFRLQLKTVATNVTAVASVFHANSRNTVSSTALAWHICSGYFLSEEDSAGQTNSP